ncbi:retron St85 family RNA-directed DNA polymerase [Thalassospira sp.]|uniref:retron St85 family RNA-directed DNA polymerase n=1 Tax=Thalassospira sp. TaxID=1912094 RepID=UPI000C4DEAA1|nr:retron St85 family RNA-directed DNA polymerase [Thalassospira sp.]MAL40379.1 hypothetical protein [Thalassospira sp.]HAY47826.1 hypothetical protein [Thalassospira sp.]|tara:strand:+ start:778 stop:1701 length:924 start_codon:yes stop_codon:yes gene_type:complete
MILEWIAKETGVGAAQIATIVRSANNRYCTYSIPKRDGTPRQISQPSKKLKFVQRWLAKRVFVNLPVHKSATAYLPGVGIRKNALEHASSKYLLKMDMSDFFPSIREEDIVKLMLLNSEKWAGFEDADANFIGKAVSYRGALTIGAPSSPVLSNAILFEFDELVHEYCINNELVYSRYADDISISSKGRIDLHAVSGVVEEFVQKLETPKLNINREKTVIVSKKHQRFITGLNLTSDGNVSVGRLRKREIRTLIFKFKSADLDFSEIGYLKGWMAYLNAVEPSFVERARLKYGDRTVQKIFEYDVDG